MPAEITRPVSTRITLEEFAKVRDSLIEQGVSEDKLVTNSNIVKTALLLAIARSSNPTSPASQFSLDLVKQLWKETKRAQKIKMDSLY